MLCISEFYISNMYAADTIRRGVFQNTILLFFILIVTIKVIITTTKADPSKCCNFDKISCKERRTLNY